MNSKIKKALVFATPFAAAAVDAFVGYERTATNPLSKEAIVHALLVALVADLALVKGLLLGAAASTESENK